MTSEEHGQDRIAQAMSAARPGDELDEARARSAVKRGLFDDPGTGAPVMLARYILLECIGSGGLGVVFAAYDPSLDRRVAIKLLQQRSLGDESEQVARERLAREAQALAQLAHPNVVAVHDVGAYALDRPLDGAQPQGVFLVMEHVDGDDLSEWARAQPRSWREIVGVHVAAGRGLEAAHRAGIVHRDFKPGNVLVGRDGRARVLDFGLAHARARTSTATEPSPDGPELASGGPSMVGTPAYMAPEQHDGQIADARSDQFAFCVTLWEALFERGPYAANDVATLRAHKRAATIVTPPPTRVPRRVVAALRRGLAPRPDDRHVDMAALLGILESAASGRRRRALATVAVATAAVAATVAVVHRDEAPCGDFEMIAGSVWNEGHRAEIDRAFAASGRAHGPATARAVGAVLDAYTAQWIRRRRDGCEAAFVRRVQSPQAANRTALCLDGHLARANEFVALMREADAATVDGAIDAVDALPSLSSCDHAAADAESTAAERALLQSLSRAEALLESSQLPAALAAAEAARLEAEAAELPAVRGQAELLVGRVHLRAGRLAAASTSLWAALSSAERSGDEAMAARALLALVNVAIDEVDATTAERQLELVQAKLTRHDLGGVIAFEAHHQRARLARLRGFADEAVAAARIALDHAAAQFPEGHSAHARAHALLGVSLSDRGEVDLARAEYEAARRGYEARLGPEHPNVAVMIDLLATLDAHAGRHHEAIAQHRVALALRERALGPDHPDVAFSLANLAAAEESIGALDDAMAHGRRALEILVATRGQDDPEAAAVLSNLANVMLDVGAHTEALATAERATAMLERSVGEDHPRTAFAIATAGIALTLLGRWDESVARLSRARRILTTRLGPETPTVPIVDKALAEAEFGAGRLDLARAHVDRATTAMAQRQHDPGDLIGARLLAAILHGETPAALEELRPAWRAAGRSDAAFDAQRDALARTLAGHRDAAGLGPAPAP